MMKTYFKKDTIADLEVIFNNFKKSKEKEETQQIAVFEKEDVSYLNSNTVFDSQSNFLEEIKLQQQEKSIKQNNKEEKELIDSFDSQNETDIDFESLDSNENILGIDQLSLAVNTVGLSVNSLITSNQDVNDSLSDVFESTEQHITSLIETNNSVADETIEDVRNNIAFMKKALVVVGVSFVAGLLGVAYVYRSGNISSISPQIPYIETNKTEVIHQFFGIDYAKTITTVVIERKFQNS
jgi:hypothetical protein